MLEEFAKLPKIDRVLLSALGIVIVILMSPFLVGILGLILSYTPMNAICMGTTVPHGEMYTAFFKAPMVITYYAKYAFWAVLGAMAALRIYRRN